MTATLVTGPIPDELLRRLQALGPVTALQRCDEATLLAALPGHDAVVSLLTAPMTAAVLATPGLRLVAQVAVGLDNVDLDAARRCGVAVTHTPGVLTDATADLTMALLLAVCRRVVEADRFARSGAWQTWSLDLLTGLELASARLGIVGPGRIGVAVARRAAAFGMALAYTGRGPAPAMDALGAERLPLPDLLAAADVVSLHLPLTEETRGLFDAATLATMRRGAYLVNTARGALVDEDALADALERGHLRGAGLDVHTDEPRLHPRLRDRDDVVLLPHIGSATDATRFRMAELAVRSVEALARGAPLERRAV